MRTFFGFDLPCHIKLEIEQWRSSVYGSIAKNVPAANFHITLQFNGATSPTQLEHILNADFPCVSTRVQCHQVGYFSKPKVGFLLVEQTPEILNAASNCRAIAKRCQLPQPRETFTPHITLYRKLKMPLQAPCLPPQFDFLAQGICLFESVSSDSGVVYKVIKKWD